METKAAVVYERSGKFNIENVQISDPNDDEVLVKIVASGICHTDLAAREQFLPIPPDRQMPCVLGHEGAGVIEKVGSRVNKVEPGDHVAISWDCCGGCPSCKSGNDPYCHNFFLHNFNGARPDGTTYLKKGDQVIYGSFFGQSSFAQHAIANQRNIVKVSQDIPLEIVGPLGCGVQTGAGAVMNALRARPGDSIAVFGSGTVGMSAILASVVCGLTTIIAVDVIPERLEQAKKLGATHVIDSSKQDPVEALLEITGGGPNFTLECVGNPAVLRQAVDALPLLGVCGLLGVVPPGTEVGLDMDKIMNGRTIKGIIEGNAIPGLFIPKLLDLYQQGKFPFDQMITYYPFEEINKAIADMHNGTIIKPVLKM